MICLGWPFVSHLIPGVSLLSLDPFQNRRSNSGLPFRVFLQGLVDFICADVIAGRSRLATAAVAVGLDCDFSKFLQLSLPVRHLEAMPVVLALLFACFYVLLVESRGTEHDIFRIVWNIYVTGNTPVVNT